METAALKPSHTDVELAELVYDAFISPLLCFPCFGPRPSFDQLLTAGETGRAGHSN